LASRDTWVKGPDQWLRCSSWFVARGATTCQIDHDKRGAFGVKVGEYMFGAATSDDAGDDGR